MLHGPGLMYYSMWGNKDENVHRYEVRGRKVKFLEGEKKVRVRVLPTTLKIVLTAPQFVRVIMSLSKGNDFARK